MRILFLAAVALVAVNSVVACNEPKPVVRAKPTTRPEPPSGYSWLAIDEANAAFLVPANWHYRNYGRDQDGLLTFHISSDEIESHKGLEVQVGLLKDLEANRFVDNWMRGLAKGDPAGQTEQISLGEWQGRAFIGKYPTKTRGEQKIYSAAIANPQTGTRYLISFMSPVAEWDSLWTTGQVIAKQFILGDLQPTPKSHR